MPVCQLLFLYLPKHFVPFLKFLTRRKAHSKPGEIPPERTNFPPLSSRKYLYLPEKKNNFLNEKISYHYWKKTFLQTKFFHTYLKKTNFLYLREKTKAPHFRCVLNMALLFSC